MTLLIATTLVIQSCGNSDNTTSTSTNGNSASSNVSSPAGGHVSNPVYQWSAIAGAAGYRLRVEDNQGNRFSDQVTAADAGCSDEGSPCSFTPLIQMHDSKLKWRVEAIDTDNQWLSSSADVAFNTLRSLTAQPYTDLDTVGAAPNPGNGWPTIDFGNLLLLDNTWNATAAGSDNWLQTVAADRQADGNIVVSWQYDWLTQTDGDEYAVKSYPQLVYGSKLGAHVSGSFEETGLPQTISLLDEFTINYRYSEAGNAERNLAFESFFHTDCDIRGPNFDEDNRAYEMMVWIANPSIRTPGSTKAVTGVLIDNQLWDVWIKPLQDKKYIAFTAQSELTQATLQWNRFVDWTLQWTADNFATYDITALDNNWCMSAIEFGTETWWGKGSLRLDEFSINVSR